jgi:hypothetical protein
MAITWARSPPHIAMNGPRKGPSIALIKPAPIMLTIERIGLSMSIPAFRASRSQLPTDLLVVEYADRKIFHTCAIELGGIKLFQYGSLQKIKENFDYPQVDWGFFG